MFVYAYVHLFWKITLVTRVQDLRTRDWLLLLSPSFAFVSRDPFLLIYLGERQGRKMTSFSNPAVVNPFGGILPSLVYFGLVKHFIQN